MNRRLIAGLLFFCMAPGLGAQVRTQALWTAGEDGYATYRIPAIVVTKRDTVLAFAVGRRTLGSDWAAADILMRRSTNGGRTFDAAQRIAGDGMDTTDNPTAIADPATGAVFVVYQQNYARCFMIRSDDDGKSFSAPVEITYAFDAFRPEYAWNVLAPGPGHGIVTRTGRMIVPVWMAMGKATNPRGPRPHAPSAVTTIYSDDQGKTWKHGEIVLASHGEFLNPSETDVVELADGTIELNMRNVSSRHRRLVAMSPDGATHWSQPEFVDDLFEPVCAAGMIRYTRRGNAKGPLLFSNPDSEEFGMRKGTNKYPRKRLAVRASYDDGKTWPYEQVLDEGTAGYSDLAVLANGKILCLYEQGRISVKQGDPLHIVLARFPLGWVRRGKRGTGT